MPLPPRLEVLATGHPPVTGAPPGRHGGRARLFLGVFLTCLAVGETWNFLRPALYRSSATVLTMAQPALDTPTQAGDLDLQHVAIQRQLLLGQPLLEHTLERLRDGGQAAHFGIAAVGDFRSGLAVTPVPDTHLVELSADGPRPALLPVLVNAWIESYLVFREQAVREELGGTLEALDAQLADLDRQLAAKRTGLEAFRARHGILSEGRTENPAHAELLALNDSLAKARERETEAGARLQTLQEAAERGEPLVPDGERGKLLDMQVEAAGLREQLAGFNTRYTDQYRFVNPEFEALPRQLAELEQRIADTLKQGRRLLLTEASQALRTARTTVAGLERRLRAQQQEAAQFTARFTEHEALRKELESLEEVHRDAAARRAALESRGLAKYPQVRVVDWAFTPLAPLHPDYTRDGLWILVGSALLGVAAVWLVDYLRRSPHGESPPTTLAGVRIYTDSAALPDTGPEPQRIGRAPEPALAAPAPRELTRPEVQALWEAADRRGRRLVGLMLSGLNLAEAAGATRADLSLDGGQLSVAARRVPLAPQTAALLEDTADDPETLAEELQLLACDAGLPYPEQVDAAALRHTYLLYLVRQGARLRELERVVGPLPAGRLSGLRGYSPQGPGRPLEELELGYPLPRE